MFAEVLVPNVKVELANKLSNIIFVVALVVLLCLKVEPVIFPPTLTAPLNVVEPAVLISDFVFDKYNKSASACDNITSG